MKYCNLLFNSFIIEGFQTIAFIFVISTSFWPICPSGVCQTREPTWNFELRLLFNPGGGVACSDSISPNRVQVLSIPVLLLACSQDWTNASNWTHSITVIGIGSLSF